MRSDDGPESTELNRIFGSLIFGWALWSTYLVASAGRACSRTFSWQSGFSHLVAWMILGFVIWMPTVAILAGLSFLVVVTTPLATRPRITLAIAIALIVATFEIAFAESPRRGYGCGVL